MKARSQTLTLSSLVSGWRSYCRIRACTGQRLGPSDFPSPFCTLSSLTNTSPVGSLIPKVYVKAGIGSRVNLELVDDGGTSHTVDFEFHTFSALYAGRVSDSKPTSP